MSLERDKYFFHYTTSEAAFEHILPQRELRFSSYMDMRDPLENKYWRFIGGAWGEVGEEEQEQQMADYFRFNRLANQIRERSFLLSMTIDAPPEESEEEEPFIRGCQSAGLVCGKTRTGDVEAAEFSSRRNSREHHEWPGRYGAHPQRSPS